SAGAPLSARCGRIRFALKPAGNQERERGHRGERVVFLAAREAEKRDDQDSPGSKQKIGALALVEARAPGAYTPRNFLQGGEQKRAPGNDPEQQEAVENQERDFSVVVGNALVQIAHELLVPEVEPEET